uniref:Ras-associating domain-containing protein n=1 Tax=Steinernema glaseri TaxID=37863 RepID=A0A1I7ZR21_9BILA
MSRQNSFKADYGKNGVVQFLGLMSSCPVLYEANATEIETLTWDQSEAFNEMMEELGYALHLSDGETIDQYQLWKCWKNLRRSALAGKPPRCWRDHLKFLEPLRDARLNARAARLSATPRHAPEEGRQSTIPFYEEPMVDVANFPHPHFQSNFPDVLEPETAAAQPPTSDFVHGGEGYSGQLHDAHPQEDHAAPSHRVLPHFRKPVMLSHLQMPILV